MAPNPTNPTGGQPSAGRSRDPASAEVPFAPQSRAQGSADAPSTAPVDQPIIRPIATGNSPKSQAPSKSDPGVGAEPHVEEKELQEDITEIALKNAPPWLISAVFHMLVMIVLALLLLPNLMNNRVDLEATFADSYGEQLEYDLPGAELATAEDAAISLEDSNLVPDPIMNPPPVNIDVLGPNASSNVSSAVPGISFDGRQPGMKQALLGRYGAPRITQEAVAAGLKWLAKNQQKDGSWSLIGPYPDGGEFENREAATAMALLAFQGDGNTTEQGEYREVVERGWYYLLQQQDGDGCFYRKGSSIDRFYTHGQATIAVCELYAMTKDPSRRAAYKGPAEMAIEYCVKGQSPAGGWRYQYQGESDVSVTGWVLMGLQSARMAGLEVPRETLDNASRFLDTVAEMDGARYRYQPRKDPTRVMTAEGLLCRQYLGWAHDNPPLQAGVEWLLEPQNQISFTRERDVYYWYYATQVMHHMDGEPWEKWNRVMCQTVPQQQVRRGREAGSWDPYEPSEDQWASRGGRLYVTCLSIYMLEVYYRHLPLYTNVFMYMQ